MSAYMIATVKVKDQQKFKEYLEKAQKQAGPLGAELVVRGRLARKIHGDSGDHQVVVIIKYPNKEALDQFYDSPDYGPLEVLRDEAAEMAITSYEAMD